MKAIRFYYIIPGLLLSGLYTTTLQAETLFSIKSSNINYHSRNYNQPRNNYSYGSSTRYSYGDSATTFGKNTYGPVPSFGIKNRGYYGKQNSCLGQNCYNSNKRNHNHDSHKRDTNYSYRDGYRDGYRDARRQQYKYRKPAVRYYRYD